MLMADYPPGYIQDLQFHALFRRGGSLSGTVNCACCILLTKCPTQSRRLRVQFHHMQKKGEYRRKGKGRRCCMGDRIYSIPFRASCFALGRFEEQHELHQVDQKKRTNFYSKCVSFPDISHSYPRRAGGCGFRFSNAHSEVLLVSCYCSYCSVQRRAGGCGFIFSYTNL